MRFGFRFLASLFILNSIGIFVLSIVVFVCVCSRVLKLDFLKKCLNKWKRRKKRIKRIFFIISKTNKLCKIKIKINAKCLLPFTSSFFFWLVAKLLLVIIVYDAWLFLSCFSLSKSSLILIIASLICWPKRNESVLSQDFFEEMWKNIISSPVKMYDTP